MQDRGNKTIQALLIQVAAILALSLPAIAYADNSSRSSAGYRGAPGMASNYRGPGRSGGRQVTRNSRSYDSIGVRPDSNNGPSSRQELPGNPAAGNRRSQAIAGGSRNLDKRQGPPSSRQGKYQGQREIVVSDKTPLNSRRGNRPETIRQLINSGQNEQFKPRKNPIAPTAEQKKPVVLTSQQEKPGVSSARQNKPGGYIAKQKNTVALTPQQEKPGVPSARHDNPRMPATAKPIKIDKNKNQEPSESFKTQGDRIRVATMRPDKYKGNRVVTKPMNSFQRPTNTRRDRDNLDNKGTLFQTQQSNQNNFILPGHNNYINYNSQNNYNLPGHNYNNQNNQSGYNQHRPHGNNKKHKHRHQSRVIYYPYVFFSYYSLYNPYRYYPYRYTSYYYPYSYYAGYYAYDYPFYEPYGYSSPAYIDEEPVYSADIPYGIDSPGWSYLVQGNFQAAIDVFANDIQSYPNAGIPKVGYALATAATGHLAEGVLTMREAFDVDPDSIRYLVFDDEMLAIIDDLIEAYEYEIQQQNKSPDENFMVATLHYLKYDYGSAHEAINRAIIDGERKTSLGQLHRLVDEQFSNAYADKNN